MIDALWTSKGFVYTQYLQGNWGGIYVYSNINTYMAYIHTHIHSIHSIHVTHTYIAYIHTHT